MVRRYAKSEDRMVLGNSLVLSQISSSLYLLGREEDGKKELKQFSLDMQGL